MNIKTYLNKTNTIIYNSEYNTGNNPVCELYYGDGYTRVLLNVDVTKITSLIQDKTYSDTTKLKHTLKMKNCWGLQSTDNKLVFNSGYYGNKERTSSFDLYLLRMPENWDSGAGNDFTKDGFIDKNYSSSTNGSNWFNSASETPWTNSPGVVSNINQLISIQTQHFNIGNEDIEMDITQEINNIISGNTQNYGFMLSFPQTLEQSSKTYPQYVGFFTNNTTTFFKPYIETTYSEIIEDDRNYFYVDKLNRLYFYSNINGALTNLDVIPSCFIDEIQYPVKQATKGVYYVELSLPSNIYTQETMMYDVWTNIQYNNKLFPDQELEFVVKQNQEYFNFNNAKVETKKYIPTVYGIKHGEKINIGDVRKIFIDPRVQYTTNNVDYITGIEYRLYVKDANKEMVVFDYSPVNRSTNSNYFLLDTNSLLPNKYFVDIKILKYDEIITHKEKLMFEIVNEN